MKKILTLAILLALLVASCKTVKMVSTKKLPETAVSAVIRANNVVDALKTMNPEIPFEDHAYIFMSDGRIGVLPPGNIAVYQNLADVLQMKTSNDSVNDKNVAFSVEAGKYYTLEEKMISRTSRVETYKAVAEELADEKKLERAKQDVAGIKEYFEYSKNHPNVLDGTYMERGGVGRGKFVIHEKRLSFLKINDEILFDGETIILLGKGKPSLPQIWYYHFNKDGNMEVIHDAKSILTGYNTVTVFERVKETKIE